MEIARDASITASVTVEAVMWLPKVPPQ
jgi:hypothetical protein